ncbi:MAG: hypothetical protein HY301_05370 [Verrucomicrobia bacterium]|nr:hypothetical protein [Verrucomicrobiota bacterium]
MKLPKVLLLAAVACTAGALLVTHSVRAAAKAGSAKDFLKAAQHGDPKLASAGAISFGPHGLLLIAETKGASIVAVDTGDAGPVKKLKHRVDDVANLVAAKLGAPAGGVKIVDLAVNPASGKIYLSVLRTAGALPAIVVIDADGAVNDLAFDKLAWVRVPLPAKEGAKIGNITDVAFAGDRVVAAGASSEEFNSKIFSLPLPLEHGQGAAVFSAETYHVSHGKWETRAPISSFVPYEENGKHYIVGAFACTPIAKFPLDGLSSGANVRGTSFLELGSQNRPLDMFTYEKGGKRWLVTHTQRFGKNLFGPSKYWGVRIDMNYVALTDAEKINEKAAHRDTKQKSGPAGIEIVDSLFGAVHVDKLDNDDAIVLRETEGSDKLVLEMAKLP